MAQADQRVDGQMKGTVHPLSLLHNLVGPVDDTAEVVDALIPKRQQLLGGILAACLLYTSCKRGKDYEL